MGSKISIDRAPEWVAKLEGKLHQAAVRGLLSAAHRTVQHIVTEEIPHADRMPVDRGIYRAGWRARSLGRDSGGRYSGGEEGAIVYNNTPHAPIIEDGARASNIKIGRRMIDALAEWVVRKGLVGKGLAKEERAQAGRSLAWAIANSMKKKGIFGGEGKGLKILAKARLRIPGFIDEEIRREIEKIRE